MALHPRLALPFTILREGDTVRLVAGEDFRYTLTSPGLGEWLPLVLERCDGRLTAEELVAHVPESQRPAAREAIDRLYGERALVNGGPMAAHRPRRYAPRIEGTGPLRARVLAALPEMADTDPQREQVRPLVVLCQDRLDYEEALRWNNECRLAGSALLWATTGPLSRAYVSPAFLPDGPPCLLCLYRHFHRLSPCPDIYDALLAHTAGGGAIRATGFPTGGLHVLAGLVCWKLALLEEVQPQAPPYRLHVLDADSLEVAAYPVLQDPGCPACAS